MFYTLGQKSVALNIDKFVKDIRFLSEPGLTTIPGVFAVGIATGPKDIVDSIISGSSVAGKVSLWLKGGLRDSFHAEEFPMMS